MKQYANLNEFLQDIPALAEGVKDKLSGQNALFKLEVGERVIFIRLQDGSVALLNECDEKPAATIAAKEDALMDMIAGKLNPMVAMFTGKVSVTGNTGALMQLMTLLKG